MWRRDLPDTEAGLSTLRLDACTYLLAHGVDAELEDASLVLSELTSNAFRHGAPPALAVIEVFDDHIRVEVDDAEPSDPTPTDEGHGLRIIEALADHWEIEHRSPGGKAVWADLPRQRRG